MAPIANGIFNLLFRRNQVFLGVVFFSAFAFEMGLSTGGDRLWDYVNRGRQWKDIKYQYMNKDDEDEE